MQTKTKLTMLAVALMLASSAWGQAAQQATNDAPAAEAPAAKPPAPITSRAGKRDPFVSPISTRRGGPSVANCTSGKRCLVIGQVTLRGVVRSEHGMIAVVENPARRVYFLRENDPVFDGQVVRITGDSIIFRESVRDNRGQTTYRDVVKRIPSGASAD